MLGMTADAIDHSVALTWTFDSTPRKPRNILREAPLPEPAQRPADGAPRTILGMFVNPTEHDLLWHRTVDQICTALEKFPEALSAVRSYLTPPSFQGAG